MSMTIGLEWEHPVIDIIMKLARLPGFISTILGIAVLVVDAQFTFFYEYIQNK